MNLPLSRTTNSKLARLINQRYVYLCTCKILNPYNSKIAIAIGIIYYLAKVLEAKKWPEMQ